MQTLQEATWNLDGALTSEKIPLYRRKRIRAAVRNVALATEQLGQDGMRHSEILAEIIRLFPKDSPHG